MWLFPEFLNRKEKKCKKNKQKTRTPRCISFLSVTNVWYVGRRFSLAPGPVVEERAHILHWLSLLGFVHNVCVHIRVCECGCLHACLEGREQVQVLVVALRLV